MHTRLGHNELPSKFMKINTKYSPTGTGWHAEEHLNRSSSNHHAVKQHSNYEISDSGNEFHVENSAGVVQGRQSYNYKNNYMSRRKNMQKKHPDVAALMDAQRQSSMATTKIGAEHTNPVTINSGL